jgi:RNA polymerase sigma factor (sigma-70 family)
MDTSLEINHLLVWRNFKSGSKDALSSIFLSNYDSLLNYGMRIYANQDFVKDCIQDVFLKLWNHRENLCDIKHIRPYLIKSLRRRMQDELIDRTKKTKRLFLYNPEDDFTFSHEDLVIADEIDKERKERLLKCLNALPKRQKELIYLRFFENLDYDTIASIMNLNLQSVRNLSFSAIKELRADVTLMQLFLVMIP